MGRTRKMKEKHEEIFHGKLRKDKKFTIKNNYRFQKLYDIIGTKEKQAAA